MVKDAESHASEDRQRREAVEEANQADSLAYQVEKSLQEAGDRVPAHEKARCEQLIGELRGAIKEQAPAERIRQLKGDLQQASHNLFAGAYNQPGGGGPAADPQHGAGPQQAAGGDDEVIDADFTER